MPHGQHTVALDANAQVEYAIECAGSLQKVTSTDRSSNFAEGNDELYDTDTGMGATGLTGAADPSSGDYFGDGYRVNGPVTAIVITNNPDNADVRYYLDGSRVPSVSDVTGAWRDGRNVLEIVSTGSSLSYSFSADGPVQRYQTQPDIAATFTRDKIANDGQGANGSTGSGAGDAYLVDGFVTNISLNGPYNLYWNGSQTTPDRLTSRPGDDPDEPQYQGRPRSDYVYCGPTEYQDLYAQWVNGSISTQEFASQTPEGQGTAQLTTGECQQNGDSGQNGDEGTQDEGFLAGIGTAGALALGGAAAIVLGDD